MSQDVAQTGLEIAVVGISCRFPGAESVDELYNNLKKGIESIEFLKEDELLAAGVSKSVIDNPDFVNARSTFASAEGFDADFFGYTPEEALIMDPQMRVMHECVWEAIENAGYAPMTYDGQIGLFVGGTSNQYWEYITLYNQVRKSDMYDPGKIVELFSNSLFNDMDLMSTRISFKLDLRGPSMNLFSSCSTSLAAVHLACQALLDGDCDLAVAGGASVMTPRRNGYLYKEGMISSRDGHCRIFDKDSSGTVFGDGVGLVVLKRLEDVQTDKDTVHAVIRGSSMNNDGNRKIGYAAPSLDGQAEVIRKALDIAELKSDDLHFIEVHGTGTKIGDPIEFKALEEVFHTGKRKQCALGSIKTNFGHLNSAAGVAGLIKAILEVKSGELFPNLHFGNPNENLDFENSPFYVNTELLNLRTEKDGKIYGGVSSFGVGGTNVHVVLESPPVPRKKGCEEDYKILGFSGKTASALEKQSSRLLHHLQHNPGERLEDVSYTLMTGREGFFHRQGFICRDHAECLRILQEGSPRQVMRNEALLDKHNIVFMFPGQGAEYPRMGKNLYRLQPVFREELDRCFRYFKTFASCDVKARMEADKQAEPAASRKESLFLLFSFEYALAGLLRSWGIHPETVMGYSFGELAAACVAGIFELEDMIAFISLRNDLMESLPAGAMLSVPLPRAEVLKLLSDNVELAVDNGESCVVGGLAEDVRAFEKKMKSKRLLCFPLDVPFASHTSHMRSIIKRLEDFLSRLPLRKPGLSVISGISGEELSGEVAVSPAYWARHICEMVNFCPGAEQVFTKSPSLFLEVGPGMDLTNLMKRYAASGTGSLATDLIKAEESGIPEEYYLYNRLLNLWTQGVGVDWKGFYGKGEYYRVPLPAYPFERKRYPIDLEQDHLPAASRRPSPHAGTEKEAPRDWFYQPSWKLAPLPDPERLSGARILMFSDSSERAAGIREKLAEDNQVITVTPGEGFGERNGKEYVINADLKADYEMLYKSLAARGNLPAVILHFLSLEGATGTYEKRLRSGFFSLLYLFQGFEFPEQTSVYVVSEGMFRVYGNESVYPGKSLMLALVKIMSQENTHTDCYYIDIDESCGTGILLDQFHHLHPAREIALRNNRRWERIYERVRIGAGGGTLKQEGIYLITGGLGNIGLSLAGYLIRRYKARVALVGRTALPDENLWEAILQDKEAGDYNRIRRLCELRQEAGGVKVFQADVADSRAMRKVVAECEEAWGRIDGVIHAAGITGAELSRTVPLLTPGECYRQFVPKIDGTRVLYEIFKDYALDFMLLISSLSPVLGGLGYTVYAAANYYLDGFFESLAEEKRDFLICVNWETWDFDPREKGNASELGADNSRLALTEEESHAVLEKVLALRGNHFIVSSGDLPRRVDKWINLTSVKEKPGLPVASSGGFAKSRPRLLTPFKEAETDLQKKLHALWTDFLGITDIGIRDNFFELGADSLKAILMISKISGEFETELPLMQFFKNPTIEDTASYLKKSLTRPLAMIPRAEPRELYAMSPAQKRLYLIQSINTGSCLYNETQGFVIQGNLDYGKMEAVFGNIILRHEILRTVYFIRDGETCQRVLDKPGFRAEKLASEPEAAPDEMIENFRRPFDLEKEIPIRIGLGSLGRDRHLLIIDINHIATDGVSDNIIIKDFVQFYNEETLPELKIQYKDYAAWLNSPEQQKIKARQREFWLREFKEGYSVMNLPLDFTRPPVREERGGQVVFTLGKVTTRMLQDVAGKTNSTLFILLLSLFNLFIARLTGQDKILIGLPAAGRRNPELEDLIGVFVNLLAVQTEIDSSLKLGDFVSRFREKMIRIYDNQEYPFEELIEELKVDRDPSRNPFIDIVFVMQSSDDFTVELENLKLNQLSVHSPIVKYDLQCTAFLKGEELEISFDYNASLFKESSIKNMSRWFTCMLGQVAEKLDDRLSLLALMTEEEASSCYISGGEGAEAPPGATVMTLFDEQARRHPKRTAVRFGTEEITYGELLLLSNKLANKMRKDGVGPGAVVALYLKPSVEMIIAILGTLKSGGAYLPVDVDYPQQRCRFMLEDSGSSYLLTTAGCGYTHLFDSSRVCYVEDRSSYADQPESIGTVGEAGDTAYIIYTSGTTGNPKGVMVGHRNLYSLFANTAPLFRFNEKDAWTLFHSYCFDFSVWEIFGALLFGGKLCVLSREERTDTRRFLKLLREERITVLNQTPSAFYNLSEEASRCENLPLGIRYIIFGGEALTPVRLKKWSSLYPDVKFINMYGITETTVHVTFKELSAEDIENNTASIGRPLPGVSAYVLDSDGSPLPPGIYGELYVGGAGVSRGYIHRPELNASVFPENIHKPGTKVFKTGDRVRIRHDGEIEYAGRVDRQVQLRGFRIELGEIEHHLLQIPGISDAVVVINNCRNEDLHIIAYFVSEHEYKVEEIKAYLLDVIPDYMIPTFVIKIDEIPLTPNKKINYRLLPDPKESIQPERVLAPANEIEQKILDIWSRVLPLEKEKISVVKNFFDLGGNSLKIMHLSRLLREELEIDLEIVYLFKYTTIRSLVHFINRGETLPGEGRNTTVESSIDEGKKRMESMLRRNRRK